MSSLNKVMLIGKITRDAEVRYTPKGIAVAEVGIAINRRYTADGEKKDEVTFIDVTLWKQAAEFAGEYGKKGREVFVEGRLSLETWDDKQTGQKRSKLKVTGEIFDLLGGRQDGQEDREQSRQERQPQRPSAPPVKRQPPRDPDIDPSDEESDIPF